MVDLALWVPGAVGARLSGSEPGGCITVLVSDNAVDELTRTLGERFYGRRGTQPDVTVCAPTKASGLVSTQYGGLARGARSRRSPRSRC